MNFTIRTATLKDINAIMNIEKNGFISQIQENKIVFEKRIKVCPETFLVFETEKKDIAGYICGEFMQKKPENAADLALGHSPEKQNPDFEYFYLSSFSILPEYRGNGNGKYLWNESLKFFEAEFKTEKTLLLLVNEDWKGAKHIYESSGFKETLIFKDFFPTEKNNTFTNGILMQR